MKILHTSDWHLGRSLYGQGTPQGVGLTIVSVFIMNFSSFFRRQFFNIYS